MDTDADFEEPSADPQIRLDYEAALGEFLVAFNHVENLAFEVIALALVREKRPDILTRIENDSFAHMVSNLALISLKFPAVSSLELIEELKALGAERNDLAHGHFDQNPFDGSYQVAAGKKRKHLPITAIRKFTARANRAGDKLRQAKSFFWFEDVGQAGDAEVK